MSSRNVNVLEALQGAVEESNEHMTRNYRLAEVEIRGDFYTRLRRKLGEFMDIGGCGLEPACINMIVADNCVLRVHFIPYKWRDGDPQHRNLLYMLNEATPKINYVGAQLYSFKQDVDNILISIERFKTK